MTVRTGGVKRRAAALVVALLLTFTAVPGTDWTLAPLDPAVASGGYALVRVGRGAAGAVAAAARLAGAEDVTALEAIDLVTARMSADVVAALRRDRRVEFIAADATVTSLERGENDNEKHRDDDRQKRGAPKTDDPPSAAMAAIDAAKAWATATGRGVTVALMDTGVASHPDLDGSVIARVDFVKDGANHPDPGDHGTFLAGLIAAHGESFSGVAPDAKIVSLRVLDDQGYGKMRSVLAAFDWVLRKRTAYRIKVLNLSFGTERTTSYHTDLLSAVVESAHFAGVTVVAAAGNAGPAARSVNSPGSDPFIVTVGSFDDRGTAQPSDDRESNFSSRGPTRDGFAKPDVLAPGEHLVSLRVPDSRRYSGEEDSRYCRLSGTSASSALVAGIAALVLQAHPEYSPTKVKGALVAGGRPVAGSRTPAVDADDALGARPANVNAGLQPSKLLLKVLAASNPTNWEGVSWIGVSWEGISWEGITWERVSWEGVTWESVTWESISWESVTWEKLR